MTNKPVFFAEYQRQFLRDVKKCEKRNCQMSLLRDVMTKLQNGEQLDPVRNRPHCLTGTNPPLMECHIKSDWLLTYNIDGDTITFVRTGTHSDLF